MKTIVNQVVFQVIRECDQFCPHCFFCSVPGAKEKLSLSQIEKGLNDLKKAGIKKINKFIISGGEPILHPDIISIIKIIRVSFPASKIRIDTNGLKFFENPTLFGLLKADIYDISVDIFHNQGMLKKEKKFKEIFIEKDGKSRLVDFFIMLRKKYNFELNVRWTSNRKDSALFKKFIKKYAKKRININNKMVTATGRAKMLSDSTKGRGYLIGEKPENFKCLIGDSLLLTVNGYWHGCYHSVYLTKLSKSGQSLIFKSKLEKLLASELGKGLPKKGIEAVLKSIKNENPKLSLVISDILKNRYWYRCQPCEDACRKNVFNQ